MSKELEFQDDNIEWLEDDIVKIQTKPGMYIAYLGKAAAFHLTKELINNAIDECKNKKSPAKNVNIIYDKSIDTLTITDDGRGISPDDLKLVCTKLNSGSKFTRSDGVATGGENGVLKCRIVQ